MVRQSSPGNSRLTAALHEGALGLLSTASFGRVVTEATRQAQHAEFVAVANRYAARARAFADELGLPGSFGSYEQLPATSSWTRRQHRARWQEGLHDEVWAGGHTRRWTYLGARHSRVASPARPHGRPDLHRRRAQRAPPSGQVYQPLNTALRRPRRSAMTIWNELGGRSWSFRAGPRSAAVEPCRRTSRRRQVARTRRRARARAAEGVVPWTVRPRG
jgi:hypothetical protein